LVLLAAVAGKLLVADGFDAYPTVTVEIAPATIALSAIVVLAGLAPWSAGMSPWRGHA
jgi:hypothetical protein